MGSFWCLLHMQWADEGVNLKWLGGECYRPCSQAWLSVQSVLWLIVWKVLDPPEVVFTIRTSAPNEYSPWTPTWLVEVGRRLIFLEVAFGRSWGYNTSICHQETRIKKVKATRYKAPQLKSPLPCLSEDSDIKLKDINDPKFFWSAWHIWVYTCYDYLIYILFPGRTVRKLQSPSIRTESTL